MLFKGTTKSVVGNVGKLGKFFLPHLPYLPYLLCLLVRNPGMGWGLAVCQGVGDGGRRYVFCSTELIHNCLQQLLCLLPPASLLPIQIS